MSKLTDRAKSNDLNCIHGAMQLLYSLAECGVLKEPFSTYATAGYIKPHGKERQQYHDAIADLSESIILFNDEIKEYGKIL